MVSATRPAQLAALCASQSRSLTTPSAGPVFHTLRASSLYTTLPMLQSRHALSSRTLAAWLLFALALALPANAIKFNLPAARFPSAKCVWNAAHDNALVIVTANVSPGEHMRVDVEIVDSSPKKNVYLHKRGIDGETRLAITTHSDGEVGVCFRNYLATGKHTCVTRTHHTLRDPCVQITQKRRPRLGSGWSTWTST
jgi:hypothetical protein